MAGFFFFCLFSPAGQYSGSWELRSDFNAQRRVDWSVSHLILPNNFNYVV